ncbi:helix-turn-helix transcriptional regulator [Cohnella terricola]|uniref:AraC family transcriptional regulator n=1 Tax=Cohnella terricola TaxID=1289167 RepID=A0A559JQL9_9BACL|nr:AraC family transcriptional regulator [Cohnella terricola]TVY02175.1 AraC family transcriptional regulator [Cohnella terricola]
MDKLTNMTPYVGDCMTYLYDGSSNEKLRTCNVYAIHLFPDGPGEMEVDGKRYPINRRTIVFLRPGQPHAFHISPRQPLTSFNLYFDLWEQERPRSLNRIFYRYPERYESHTGTPVMPCSELDALPSVSSLQTYPLLFDLFQTIVKQFEEISLYRTEAVNSLFFSWMLGWYNAIHTPQPSDYRIVRLLAKLDSNPELREPVADWWQSCGLKRTYFHELFLRETGLTPKAYQHKQLMRRAAQLLQESDASVTVIAEKLGYPSIHPFTRHFSSYYGVSPREFRMKPLKLRQ